MKYTSEKRKVSSSLNILAKTSFVVFVGLAISKILTYAYRLIAARVFGPENYGLFSLALIISGWFIAIATLGFAEGIIRYVSLYRGKKQSENIAYLFRFSFLLLSITSIVLGGIMFIGAETIAIKIFHEPKLILFLQIFSIAVPLTTMATPLLSTIRAFERIGAYSGIFNILQNIFKVLILSMLIFLGIGEQSISISYLAGLAIVVIASYWYCKKHLSGIFVRSKLKSKSKIRSELFHYSWPLLFYGILSTLLYWIDSFSLGYFKEATVVGYYNAAVPIALLLGITSEVFSQLFLPMITRYYATRNIRVIKELSKQVTKWVLAVNLPAFGLMLLFPGVIINILFGSEYLVASTALQILSIGGLITSLSFIPLHLVAMTGKSKVFMANICVGAILNLILNFILIPMDSIGHIDNSLGINGAAIATLISLIVFNLLFFLEAYNYTKIFPLRRKMLNVIVAIIPAFLLAIYFRNAMVKPSMLDLIGVGMLFLITYGLFLFLLKSFDYNDWEVIQKIKGKTLGFVGKDSRKR